MLFRSDGVPVGYRKTNPSANSSAFFLVRLFTRRRSTAVSVTGFRMYLSIYLGVLETSNSSHLYHRQDLPLLLPYIPEYNSVFAVHSSFSFLLLSLLDFLAVLSNAMKYKQYFMIVQKFFSERCYITDLLIFPFLIFILNVIFNYKVVH